MSPVYLLSVQLNLGSPKVLAAAKIEIDKLSRSVLYTKTIMKSNSTYAMILAGAPILQLLFNVI